jgi:hypothetical protein
MFAAPREVWASALKASAPASKIAAVAIKVTVSLRIDSLPEWYESGSAIIPPEQAKNCQLKFFNDAGNGARSAALVFFGRRRLQKNPRPARGYGMIAGRGLRHAAPRIAGAHDRPQELTMVQCKITEEYVA